MKPEAKPNHKLVPKKLVLGLRSYQRMNSLISNWGLITDQIMSLRNTKMFAKDYFTHVSPWTDQFGAFVYNPETDTSVRLTVTDLIYTTGRYWDSDAALNFEKAFELGKTILLEILKQLPLVSIRRIGIVGEYRAKIDGNASEFLFKSSKLKSPPNPSGFNLRYESRRYEDPKIIPADIDAAEFRNIMFNYYDSQVDEKPETNAINANIDVQQYFWPPADDKFGVLMTKHFRSFQDESKEFKKNAKTYGLIASDEL